MSGATVVPPRPAPGEQVRPLTDADLPHLQALLAAHPYSGCVLAARVEGTGTLDPGVLGGAVLGVWSALGRLTCAAYVGGSVVPVGGGPDEARALADALGAGDRRVSEIVGDAVFVGALWDRLRASWGPERDLRPRQPLLAATRPAPVPADTRVRRAVPGDLEAYVPAAAAMFTEELGVSPFDVGGEAAYASRLGAVIRAGRAFVLVDDGEIVFKAEVGAVSRRTAQVQGVWVRPDRRGTGIGTGAMAQVTAVGLQLAPAVSLYVNDYNVAARALYRRCGFESVGELATVLF